VVIVTGHTYNGIQKPVVSPSVPTKTKPQVSPVSTSMLATWQNMARQLHYPVLVPTVAPKGSVFSEPIEVSYTDDPRVYKLNGQLASHLTAYAGYRYDPTHVWGMQWTKWTTAPILLNPSSVRLVKGKSGKHVWKLYYNGGQIHRIAVFYGKNDRYVAWVDNSLGDGFSNSTMIAIAKGLKPVSP
jgi:hypothetical protein